MHRREFVSRAIEAGTATSLAGCGGGGGGTPTRTPRRYRNPVFEPILADPAAIRAEDGTYYAYGTEDSWGDGEGFRTVPIVSSEDLVEWSYEGTVFGTRASLDADPSSGDPSWKYNGHGVWAPGIVRAGGTYRLYYSLFGPTPGESAIGVATADGPTGPWTDHGRVVGDGGNSIDPRVYAAGDATYLFWGSYGQPIYAATLSEDGRSVTGEWRQVTSRGFEAPYPIERDGRHYLFVSAGQCCPRSATDYHLVVGRADAPLGPYVGRDGTDLIVGGGTTVLDGDDRFAGPGHNSVAVDDAGDDWLVYHAYDTTEPATAGDGGGPRRSLMVDRIAWEDGWPRIGDGTPSASARAPHVDA